tara:strand:- start:4815 stop:6047 length:1233 start_codon:yes stop_codon:yes gene_type:complete
MKFLQGVLKANLPKKSVKLTVGSVLDNINSLIKKNKIEGEAILGGSYAKNTHLENFDCDIFVKFDMKYKEKNLSIMLEKILKSFKPEKIHGSRDYFKFKKKGVLFEVVPVLNITSPSDAQNVTDVSPLHVDWINSHVKKLSDDIRLSKLFCKAQGIYGAESYINGFSGYILEVLTIHYGGFKKLLKGVTEWRPKQCIDVENYYHSRHDISRRLNKAKLHSPLIIIDPVQPNRNIAASLSNEQFSKFILSARLFLHNPSKSFFKSKEIKLTEIKKKAKQLDCTLIMLNVVPLQSKKDVVGSKLLKAYDFVKTQLENNDFNVLDSGWSWSNKSFFWYMVYPDKLSKFERHPGPLVYSGWQFLKPFTKKYQDFIIDNFRIYVLRKRKFYKLKDVVNFILKDEYLKDKVKKIRI